MFSREAGVLIKWFILAAAVSIVFASPTLLLFSLLPLFFLNVVTVVALPKVTRAVISAKTDVWTNEIVDVNVSGETDGGFGIISLHVELPDFFRLEAGSNYCVFWNKNRKFNMSFSVRCTKRGTYPLGPLKWVGQHPLNLLAVERGGAAEQLSLTVQPRIINVRRLRQLPNIGRSPFPLESMAKIGAASTDFGDLREYAPGDPVKSINWRASAKRLAYGVVTPIVKEYEKEGKQSVFIFLDVRGAMKLGTAIENALEHAIEAANGVAYYYLNRGFKLWLHFIGSGRGLAGDTGSKQYLRLLTELLKIEPMTEDREDFEEAVEKNRRTIAAYTPLCIIITTVNEKNIKGLLRGIIRLIKYRGLRRKTLPIVVINVIPYSLLPPRSRTEWSTSRILTAKSAMLLRYLVWKNVATLNWNPNTEDLAVKLLRQVIMR